LIDLSSAKQGQQQHHHHRTNGSTNVKTFSPDNMDLLNSSTVFIVFDFGEGLEQ
jgi:hypothetical protein